jgi:hypothetical protein
MEADDEPGRIPHHQSRGAEVDRATSEEDRAMTDQRNADSGKEAE